MQRQPSFQQRGKQQLWHYIRWKISTSFTILTQGFVESAAFGLSVRSFNECFIVTDTNRFYEKPPTLTLSLVYKLMELERIEMDKRVTEKHRHIPKFKVSTLVGFDGRGKKISRLSTGRAVSKGN